MRVVFIMLCFLSTSAFAAVSLPNLPEPPNVVLAIDPAAPPIACDQIMAELDKFKEMNREHEDSISAFLGQTVDVLTAWYAKLQPLEGQKDAVPVDSFLPVQDGVDKMGKVVNASYDDSALLAGELDRIISSLRDCQISAQTNLKLKSKTSQ